MTKQGQVNEVYTNLITFVDGLDVELNDLLKQNNQILMDQNRQFLNMMEKQNSDLIQFVNGNIENTLKNLIDGYKEAITSQIDRLREAINETVNSMQMNISNLNNQEKALFGPGQGQQVQGQGGGLKSIVETLSMSDLDTTEEEDTYSSQMGGDYTTTSFNMEDVSSTGQEGGRRKSKKRSYRNKSKTSRKNRSKKSKKSRKSRMRRAGSDSSVTAQDLSALLSGTSSTENSSKIPQGITKSSETKAMDLSDAIQKGPDEIMNESTIAPSRILNNDVSSTDGLYGGNGLKKKVELLTESWGHWKLSE